MTRGVVSYWRQDIVKIRGLVNQLFNYVYRGRQNELIKKDAMKLCAEIDRRFNKGRSQDARQNPTDKPAEN